MIDRKFRLVLRRKYRQSRKQVESIGTQTEDNMEKHFFRRLVKLGLVKRFLISWVLLLVIMAGGILQQFRTLTNYYTVLKPTSGGIFTEGIVGTFSNASPLYATSGIDASVSRLIFASLFKYDQSNQLVGDLAEKWAVDEKGTKYTVTLRSDLKWQDDYPLTASDVVFTYQSIQNPDTKSPLATSWKGVTVSAPTPNTVEFVLPNTLSSFPYSMINGIVPRHLLSSIPPSQLRSISFNNSHPVGAGPFSWSAIEVKGQTPDTREQQIALTASENYHAGKPKINKFIIRSFHDEKKLISSFKNQELTSAAGLADTPANLKGQAGIIEYNVPLLSEVMVFLKTTGDILSDVHVRQAITRGTDPAMLANGLNTPLVPARGPLLKSQLGYEKSLLQLAFDQAAANKLLDDAGWVMGPKGIREKSGKPLSISLDSHDSPEYSLVVSTLKKQWHAIGIDTRESLLSDSELQTNLTIHDYDAIVYGIGIGLDPDVFAYWHSSQASPTAQSRLNLSEYKSTVADNALEGGRTRSDPAVRAAKYRSFQEVWRNDAPAIALYQPRFLYLSRGKIFGFNPSSMTIGADRYASVENWMIKEARVSE